MVRTRIALAAPEPPLSPTDDRIGWFEGGREGRICGWTGRPSRTDLALSVILTSVTGARLTVKADRFRADLQAIGLPDGYHGFSIPFEAFDLAAKGVRCEWADNGLALPGSPWSPSADPVRHFRRGSIRLGLDRPLAGDPRLIGHVHDIRRPFRRVRIAARWGIDRAASTRATLYRSSGLEHTADPFHGFILPLPAPLRMLSGGVQLIDVDADRLLANLKPKSL